VNTLSLLQSLPDGTKLLLALSALVPVAIGGVGAWLARERAAGLATTLAARAVAIFGVGFAFLTTVATLSVLSTGLTELYRRHFDETVRLAGELSAAPADAPIVLLPVQQHLAMHRARRPDVVFTVTWKDACGVPCMELSAEPDVRPGVERWARVQVGRTEVDAELRTLTLGGEPYLLMASATRDRAGVPDGVVIAGVSATWVAAQAGAAAWKITALGYVLLVLVGWLTRRLLAANVATRIRSLIARVDAPELGAGTPNTGTVTDELSVLSESMRVYITRSVEALRRSEATYGALVEHALYGIFRFTVNGRFVAVNPALVRMLGYENDGEVLALDPVTDVYADAADFQRVVDRCRESDHIEGMEVEWRRRDGSTITVRVSGRVVRSVDVDEDSFEMIAEDVTDQRALEAQLRQAQKMEAIGQLSGGIAHDFNNILTVILANADLIAAGLPPAFGELKGDLVDLQNAARRGSAMVRKLLGFSRQEMLAFQTVDITQLADDLLGTLRRLLPETIEIQHLGEKGLCKIQADPGAIEQILVNMATNSRDAMPKGGLLRIETRRGWLDEHHKTTRGWGEPGEYVCLGVSDTGEGMDERALEKIFEPFFTTKPPGKGTGLGMAMVYGLVKQHGGYVDVRSAPGEGTTVQIYFPITLDEAQIAPDPRDADDLRGGNETILLVEDEAPIRRSAMRVLEQYGYTVLPADDGKEALKVFHERQDDIALVISDVVMPRLGGHGLYQALRREHSDTKFIFMSGYAARDVRASIALDNSIPFLHKPWTVTELVVRVREVLDSNSAK
jgi:PAS domain S-box-containing protein